MILVDVRKIALDVLFACSLCIRPVDAAGLEEVFRYTQGCTNMYAAIAQSLGLDGPILAECHYGPFAHVSQQPGIGFDIVTRQRHERYTRVLWHLIKTQFANLWPSAIPTDDQIEARFFSLIGKVQITWTLLCLTRHSFC